MSYLPVGYTPEQEAELLDLRRREVELQEKQYADSQGGKFWSWAKDFVSIGLPIATFLGFREYLKHKRRTAEKPIKPKPIK